MPGNQATYLNTLTLSEMTDLVTRTWKSLDTTFQRNARQLYNVDYIGAGQGGSKNYIEYDSETFARYKAQGSQNKKASAGIGYNKTMYARSFSREIDISWEMRVQNKKAEVGQRMVDLARFCPERQELDLTHRFTFATSSSYTDMDGETVDTTMGDGNPLAYATHDLAFSSTQYRNRVVGDPQFSQGAYEAALLLAKTQTLSNFGEQRVLTWGKIFSYSDPSTMREIKQMLTSTADIDAVQSGITNVYSNTVSHVELPYLATTASGAYDSTKRRWWGIVATGMNGLQAYLGEWVAPELMTPASGNNGEDIHTGDWTYATRCMYGIAFLSGRGCVMSCPTS